MIGLERFHMKVLTKIQKLEDRVAAAKKRTGALREPFYKTGDGLHALKSAVENMDDAELKKKVENLHKAFSQLQKYLDSNYLWD
jgi:septal ring factor EnvC (AmiA/AmiB activator)